MIRLAPNGPEKIGDERTGRLVLDGDVILPADGATVTERRRIGYGGLITVALPVSDDLSSGLRSFQDSFKITITQD